jgi:hypothetical protein
MHVKRCAIQPALDDSGRPQVSRRITNDLRRYAVLHQALVTFGHGSREIRCDVTIDGLDLDDMLPILDRGEIVIAHMVIDDGGVCDLPVVYRLTNAAVDHRPFHRHNA